MTLKGREALGLGLDQGYADEDEDDFELPDHLSDEDGFGSFANFALLSNIAVWLRDEVPRGTHVKGSIPYPRAFTGKDIVNTLQTQIRRVLLQHQGSAENDRYIALLVARSLQQQLFFYEVEWGGRVLQDGVEDVYMFLDDADGPHDGPREREELPTSVITVLTRCYSPGCSDDLPCYSFACPRKAHFEAPIQDVAGPEPAEAVEKEWAETVDPTVLRSLPESEVNRQTIIHRLISKEAQYVRDLELIDTLFIKPLRYASPSVFPTPVALDAFIDDVFGNLSAVRDSNCRLLDMMNVRQREHALVIKRIGDVLLEAATEFRLVYPTYIAHVPIAEKRLKDEVEKNLAFRLLLDQCQRRPEARRIDLKTFLNRPVEHLQKYEITLEAIAKETDGGNPDAAYLLEAAASFKNLQTVCTLQAWQHAMCKGPMSKFEWHNLISDDVREAIAKKEQKRQNIIFELIKGEMQYVKDLENIDVMYVQPLLHADPPVIPRERVRAFVAEVFNNFAQLHAHHQRLLERLHATQLNEHPVVHSITAAVFDAALNWREAYMEYITNYPKAEYRIVDEMATNPAFKEFVEQCTRHPDANRLDMKNFVNRPIPRLARYELLLKSIMEASADGHEDRESIPHVIEVIRALLKETEPGVASAEQKVELWKYNANLVWKQGEYVDLDLLDDNRSLIHAGRLLRPPETGFEWNGWSELFVLLFDNYLVMTKPKDKDKDGVTKYHVTRRPIPLELLTVANFTDGPTQRGAGILRFGNRGGGGGGGGGNLSAHPSDGPGTLPLAGATTSPESSSDSRLAYPCTLHHTGRLGGLHVLYAESAQARAEWREKLAEAQGLRKVVQEANKVFEVETLSIDTFLAPSFPAAPTSGSWNGDGALTGQVTCSVPFTTADGRALVAVGCAEGVWIGFRHDARSMRRVLHLKMVTQCAMLEEFGIFLVLADKSLFAYHIEALVPSSPHLANTSQTPQKLNGTKDVHFFSVGKLGDRTLVIYMKKKGMDSIFRVLEPVVDKINEKAKQPISLGSRLGFRAARSDWFRVYKDFFLPSESYDLIFLKARIAVLCTKGFEIMDLNDFKSVTIPQRDDTRQEKLAKRCESCRPMGMFRTSENEFLLCYDAEFGLFVNRHGDPSKDKPLIEWEGTAERVAWHPPYILIFDTRFIEVRTVETGRLCQIIQGEDVRAIWDGRGTSQPPPNFPKEGQTWQDIFGLETRIHGVMRAPDPPPTTNGPLAARRPVVAQHVFELVPTIPLYVPERLGSPTQQLALGGGYHGPMSNSPPQSPRHSSVSVNWR
ncbi:Dbl-like domain-containing protein [Vararia minispora EC-137]|uniref:Dbl-like domain-containing protein n=1 Tax=Vararia minispora EC-137 TaxID=1314806 RepID=A0ACB8QU06_9AGAM|nr:Dbl-like domain-containing protein [Vararia minispora EC-137]